VTKRGRVEVASEWVRNDRESFGGPLKSAEFDWQRGTADRPTHDSARKDVPVTMKYLSKATATRARGRERESAWE
jgi:hypothetical protein